MIKVGITGGIGSGKSIVSKILTAMNYPVYNSDIEAKRIVQENRKVRSQLIELFGKELYINNQLNRSYLASIIFNDDVALKKVNNIIHPQVRKDFETFCESQNKEIVFNEAAILFETGGEKQFDQMVLVTADEDLRISRVMKRDGIKKSEVQSRIGKQWPDEKKIPLADFVVKNNGKEFLIGQVEELVNSLREVYNSSKSSK
ncbi:MAG: dephospho-CoA kinase [Flavobacteriales bacterium]|nr:dephospho-CoA kinase [Flavobacteriales bacterium]